MKIGLFDRIVSHRVSSLTASALALALLTMGLPTGVGAQTHRIKLTTIAPRDSSYHKALQRMGQEWRRASGGTVEVIIYPGGIQGGEAAMVDRMRINQVQAALLTGTGLTEIEDAVAGLQNMPMVFRSLDELDYVSEQLRPMPVGIEPGALRFDERVEARVVEHAVQPLVKRVPRAFRQIRGGNPHRRMPRTATAFPHGHGRQCSTRDRSCRSL